MGQLAAIGPWADLSWEIPTCVLEGGVGSDTTPLTWKQYAIAWMMLREARRINPGAVPAGAQVYQYSQRFLFCLRFTCNFSAHSTPYYGGALKTPRTIEVINRPAGYGVQTTNIAVQGSYSDEESYTIAVNPTFRPDPNLIYEILGRGVSANQWVTWDDVYIALQALRGYTTWNQPVPMFRNGSYYQIDQFLPSNVLLLRWTYRFARANGYTMCQAFDQIRQAKALNVQLSTVGVDEFSGSTLDKTYRVYITQSGWFNKANAFGPTLVIPPADVRDSNRRNQNEDTRKREKRMSPSYEFMLMEAMSLVHPYNATSLTRYSPYFGYLTRTYGQTWGAINNAAIANARNNPQWRNYDLAYTTMFNDIPSRGYSSIIMFDQEIPTTPPSSVSCDEACQEAYRAWAEDSNYGVHPDKTWDQTKQDWINAVNATIHRISSANEQTPTPTAPGTVRG